jgi:hypothetical protein
LKEIADDLKGRVTPIDDRVIIEYKDVDEYEAHFRVGGDILIFNMHSNVFKFDDNHSHYGKHLILKENPNRGYCGVINIYNFLNDSFQVQ